MKKLLFLLLTLTIVLSLASCDWFEQDDNQTTNPDDNHEHTWEYIQYETGHFKQFTCGCPSPDIMGEHYDNDGDLFCDVCGYDMSGIVGCGHQWDDGVEVEIGIGGYVMEYTCLLCGSIRRETFLIPPENHFLRNQAGCEWLNEITAEDIAEVKIINQYVGVAPGTLKNISTSTDESVNARIFEDYYWLDTTPISKENGEIDGGSAVTVKFILKDGGEKELYINNGNYCDTNGNYFDLLYTPRFEDADNARKSYGFISYTGKCEVWYEDATTEPYFLCEIPIGELEFECLEFELPDEVSEYPYFIKTDFATLGFYSNDIFFIVGEGQYYLLVGKNLDELIFEYNN